MPPVEIVITPSEAEYDDLVADLAALRDAGAESNTKAMIAAVHRAAAEARSCVDGPELAGLRERILDRDASRDEALVLLAEYIDLCLAATNGLETPERGAASADGLLALRDQLRLTCEVEWANRATEILDGSAEHGR